jgi:hypothetical protein
MAEDAMMQRLSAKLRLWSNALAGMDDPLGEYLLSLEERIRRLEGEVALLRESASANAAAAVSMLRKTQPPDQSASPRATDLL